MSPWGDDYGSENDHAIIEFYALDKHGGAPWDYRASYASDLEEREKEVRERKRGTRERRSTGPNPNPNPNPNPKPNPNPNPN